MAITQSMPTTAKRDLLNGIHAFGTTVARAGTTPDSFKLALYTDSATLDASTATYTTSGEVSSSGTNYTAGGNTLTTVAPSMSGTTALLDFNDLTFSGVTLTARGAMIYNDTQSDKAVAILDFGADKSATAGDFTIIFPAADASNAIIKIL